MIKSIAKSIVPLRVRKMMRAVQSNLSRTKQPQQNFDPLGFYDFILKEPFGEPWHPRLAARKTINWVIPDVGIGGGGHLNIFRFIRLLEQLGWENRIIVAGDCRYESPEHLKRHIDEHFFSVNAQAYIGRESMPPAWFTVATEWRTAYPVRDFQATAKKCYFVQDFEPSFFAPGSDWSFAEDTYRFGFHGITAGRWLADKLRTDYGMSTDPIGFSYDRHLYAPRNSPRRRRQIFFYARSHTPRRGFELGLLVLNEVAKRIPDLCVVMAGDPVRQMSLPFEHRQCGVLALDQLADIYGECEAALVLSFTNLSLLPLELMACGCPVVTNRGANVEWLLNNHNAVLAAPNVEALAEAMVDLLNDSDRLAAFSRRGLDFVAQTDWQAEAGKMAAILERIADA